MDGVKLKNGEQPGAHVGRKRVFRACEACRRKRLRCTAAQYPCTNCQLYHTQCIYSGQKSYAGGEISTALVVAEPRRAADKSPPQSIGTNVPPSTIFPHEPAFVDQRVPPALDRVNEQHQNESQAQGMIEQRSDSQNYGMQYRRSGYGLPADSWDGREPFFEGGLSENFDFTSVSFDSLWMNVDQSTRILGAQGAEIINNHQSPSQASIASSSGGKVSGIDSLLQKGTPAASKAHIPPGLFVRKDAVNSNFIGLHSTGAILGFCIKESIERHHELIGYDTLQALIPAGRYVDEAGVQPIADISLCELPERAFAESGVNAYFENVHFLYPVLEVEKFCINWPRLYDRERYQNSSYADYLEFFLIVTIGVLSKPRNPDEISDVEGACHNLFERCWKMLNDVLISPSIGSVQILILHVIYHVQTGRLGFAWVVCGLAIRIAQSLGLHRRSPHDLDMSDQQIRFRSQLWWVAYSLDTFVSETQGRPMATIESDIDTEIFPLISEDHLSLSLAAPVLDIYCWNVKFSRIRNQFCALLSRNETIHARLDALAEIDTALLRWRDEIPMEYQPDQENLATRQVYHFVGFLHLEYFNMLRAVHWMSFATKQTIRETKPSHHSPRIQTSESICLAAARSVIETMNEYDYKLTERLLLTYISITAHEDQNEVYRIRFQHNHCISALAIVFRNIFRYPHKLSTRADLEIFRAGKIHLEYNIHADPDSQASVLVIGNMMKAADRLLGLTPTGKLISG